MALSSQARECTDAPPAAWLVCAACSPLNLIEWGDIRTYVDGVPGIHFTRRSYVVDRPVPFPVLYRWIAGNEEARERLAAIEKKRMRRDKTRPFTHEELAASARVALLLGDAAAFEKAHARYVEGIGGWQWHPDACLADYCESVLGPGLQGFEYIPPGRARDDIALVLSNVRSIGGNEDSAEAESGDPVFPAEEICSEKGEEVFVAAALRAADAARLEPLVQKGSELARAAQVFLAGLPGMSLACFECRFGCSVDGCHSFAQSHSLPLLLYALIGRMLAGGPILRLRAWLSCARQAVSLYLTRKHASAQRALAGFLDNLLLVDSHLHRRSPLPWSNIGDAGYPLLPIAVGYAALPDRVRRQVKPQALVEAVELAARRGLRLLALYGASGLLQGGDLPSRLRERLEELLEGVERSTLPQLPEPASVRVLEALRKGVQQYERCRGVPLQFPRVHAPVLLASCEGAGVSLRLEEWEPREGEAVPPALRRLRQFADGGDVFLEGASPAEFTRLFVELQPQVEVVGSLAAVDTPLVPAEPQPVLLLSHVHGGHCVAALRLRLLPGASPLMAVGCGLDVPVLEWPGAAPLAVQREMKGEWSVAEKTVCALEQAGLADAAQLLHGTMAVRGLTSLLHLQDVCCRLGLETCWEEGYALKLFRACGELSLRVGKGTGDWLELGGGLPVDEGRVLELSALLKASETREGNALCLGRGEYLLLTPELESRLSLLELLRHEKKGRWGVPASAIPLLEAVNNEPCAAVETAEPPPLPPGLQAALRPYQKEGYRWLAERAAMGLGALLADDMGLGKTVQVLALLLHAAGQEGAGASLVIAPVSLLGNWKEEVARFAPSLQVITCDPKKPDCLKGLGATSLVLASYGQVVTRRKEFAAHAWNVVALDEAQAIKNPDSQRAGSVCTLRARVRLCLTGTPVENSLLDLWSQMRFLNPGLLGARAAFLRRFRNGGVEEMALLRRLLSPLVLRRSKSQVLTQLPPLTETVEWVEFSREERALYESLRRSAMARLGQGSEGGGSGISILAELTRLRRACCHGKLALPGFEGGSAKLAAMSERVAELRAAGRRVLIFSQFTDVLDLAQELLQQGGITCLRLDGSTAPPQRNRLVKRFQQGGVDCFLISLKAGGAGLNLTAADYVMLLDPWWNPAVEAQAAGRSHRMGQQNPVTLCRFMVRGTVEERILELHKDKQELAESVLCGSTEALTLAHLRALLG